MKHIILPSLIFVALTACQNADQTKTDIAEKENLYSQQDIRTVEAQQAQQVIEQASYLLDNETVVLEFKTKNKKRLTVCRDKDNNYLVYRFGTENKVELQYPEKLDKSSFKKFSYSSYLRGGGIDNSGLDLKYLSFTNNGYRYVIYKTYAAESEGNEDAVGIRIMDLKTKKETDISGDFKSFKGSFSEEIMDRVNQSEELFD